MPRVQKAFLASGVILLFVSVALIRLPLLNYLGYEFSFAVALLVPWCCGIPAVRMFQRQFASSGGITEGGLRAAARDALIRGYSILLIPVIVATVNTLFVKNCSYLEGLLFYALLPGVAAFWSISLASFCSLMFRRALRLYMLAVAAVLLYPLYVGYSSPQIYSYNFIYGFFPGFSYDEVLAITPRLALFRLVTVLTGLLLFCLSQFIVRNGLAANSLTTRLAGFSILLTKRRLHAWIALLALLCALAWFLRMPMGFETSADYVERALGSSYSTDHFRICYSSESITPSEIRWVAALHEFRFSQVEAALQIRFRGRIVSYIYPDAGMKLRMIGTKTTNIAKPWRREIHLDKNSLESALKHELVHVLAGEFGMPLLRAHYHIGLVEGLAMAVDGDFGNRTLEEYGASAKKFDLITDPQRLINPVGFAMKSSTVSYVLMGSFCRYLIDRYGIVLFRQLYGGKSPVIVYGKSYDGLIEEWQSYLDRFEIPESWRRHAEFYFRRPSVFAKECAREIAKRNEEGYRNLSRHNAAAAMKIFSAALISSWNTDSYAGLVRSAYDAGRYDTVVQLIGARAADSLHRSALINLNLLYGDALWYRGDALPAEEAYQEILQYDLSDPLDEAAALRLAAIGDTGLRVSLPDYFVGSLSDSASLHLLSDLRRGSPDPVIPFLQGRIYLRTGKYGKAIEVLAPVTGKMTLPILNARAEQMLGEASFRQRDFARARVHFWQSLNFITNAASARRVDDWIDRCEWFEKNALRYLGTEETR